MLAVRIPEKTGVAARLFLHGWSLCMQAMMHMTDEDKHAVESIFKTYVVPEANCPEGKALDEALITYLLHKCATPEGVGSLAGTEPG